MHVWRNDAIERAAATADDPLEGAFGRVLDAPPVPASDLRLLRDAAENYPAWLAAIRAARETIDFEQFILADDETGRVFAEALIERARAGVAVRLLYDWLGCCGRAFPSFWRPLVEAGVAVRAFGRPTPTRPHWFVRDHRKLLVVDRAAAFVAGLCVSDDWTGKKGGEPWRDTGVALGGPAAAALADGFSEMWARAGGEPIPERDGAVPAILAPGDARARIAEGRPGERRIYRFDLIAAACARSRIWLTDSYFLPTRSYVEALREAARAGVDVRLLVPGRNDVPLLPAFVRTGYRPLLEAGVRVYEWSGAMLHAKTAVIDGRLSRVGSTNLNAASFFGNYELDVVVEGPAFAAAMEAAFLEDLTRATEIVAIRPGGAPPLPRLAAAPSAPAAPAARGLWRAGAMGLGAAAAAAITQRAPVSRLEQGALAALVAIILAACLVLTFLSGLVIVPVVGSLLWLALALSIRLLAERRRARVDEMSLARQTRRLSARLAPRRAPPPQ